MRVQIDKNKRTHSKLSQLRITAAQMTRTHSLATSILYKKKTTIHISNGTKTNILFSIKKGLKNASGIRCDAKASRKGSIKICLYTCHLPQNHFCTKLRFRIYSLKFWNNEKQFRNGKFRRGCVWRYAMIHMGKCKTLGPKFELLLKIPMM